MIVLGAKAGEHDACFALVKDGEPLFVYEVERFNRVKHGVSSDLTVLFQGLADHGITPSEVDLVANCGDTSLVPVRLRQTGEYLSGPAFAKAAKNVEWRHPTFHRMLVAAGFDENNIVNVRHHLCHVASVFYASTFDNAAVLTLDGSGEADTGMLASCSSRDGIKILQTISMPHSIGRFYEAATQWLGWGFGDEGKTMALAAYGDPTRYITELSGVFHVDSEGFFEFDTRLTNGSFSYSTDELIHQPFEELFGPRRKSADELEQRHMDVAAATQHLCEQAMVRLAITLKKQTRSNALLLAGGVALNSVSNGAIRDQGIFQHIVVFPHVTDAGTALGAALRVYHQNQRRPHDRWHMTHPFLGRQIDLAEVHKAAEKLGIEGTQCSDPAAFAAGRLAAGQIVGWVQGRAEIGPRALGNRSILGNPLIPGIKDRINLEVKHRENWRPFAPSVLEADMGDFFDVTEPVPFMTIVAQLRSQWHEKLSSICHVDGTARVGSVNESFNSLFYRLIQKFKMHTGIGMVLNTSFNDRGEPLVQTCEQALRLFASSGMDVAVIGNWAFEDKRNALVYSFDPLSDNCRALRSEPTLLVALPETDYVQRAVDVLLRERRLGTLTLCTMRKSETLRFPGEVLALDSPAQLSEVAVKWRQLVVLAPWSADRFVFDPTVYYSEIAEASRRLVESGFYELFWIDPLGQVVRALEVLYVHHPTQPFDAIASPARYWRLSG